GVRDGLHYDLRGQPVTERYDVIVIGGGIGGLATAHYLRKARPKTRILILDNHDDFGGHARRNEFDVDGRFLLGYGGSESMEGPKTRWTNVARACVASLGVDLDRFEKAFHLHLYPGLGLSSGLFFPREVYGVDRLLTGDPGRSLPRERAAHLHHGRPAARPASPPAQWSASRGLHRRLSDRRGAESAPAHAIHGHARRARREESCRERAPADYHLLPRLPAALLRSRRAFARDVRRTHA